MKVGHFKQNLQDPGNSKILLKTAPNQNFYIKNQIFMRILINRRASSLSRIEYITISWLK